MTPFSNRLGPLVGWLTVRVMDAASHRVLDGFDGQNLILNAARSSVAQLLAGVTGSRNITHIAFGSNGTAPALSDALLVDEYKRLIVSADHPQPSQVRFRWTLRDDEANGLLIREFGLYTADSTLFSRKVRGAPIAKSSSVYLVGDWTIEQT